MTHRKILLRVAFEIAAASILFFVLFSSNARNSRSPVFMEIGIERQQPARLWLWANGKAIAPQLKNSSRLQIFRFGLPGEEVRDLRLSLHTTGTTISLRRMSLAVLFRKIDFSLEQMRRIFAHLQGVQKVEVKKNDIEFQLSNRQPQLVFSRDILPSIARMSRDRTWVAVRSLAAALAFFWFLHSFSLARLRLRCPSKIEAGMAACYLLLLLLPFTAAVLRLPDPYALNEKRELAPRPEFIPGSMNRFPRAFDEYFNDHFRFRPLLIRLHNLSRVRWFGVSPIPQVLIGKKGWLYYARENPRRNVIDYYRAAVPFTSEEMEKWRMALEARRDWLASRGIGYLVVMVPNKSTIYPEYLPSGLHQIRPQSRLDQLLDYLRTRSTFRILDLRPALVAAKSGGRLYHKTDSHWNDAGAFVAYRQILRELGRIYPVLHPRPLSDFFVKNETTPGGDLAIMLGFPDILKEEQVILEPRTGPRAVISEPSRKISPWVMRSATESPVAAPLKVLMLRDSFGHELMNFLSEHFARIVYHWDVRFIFDTSLIEREKPDIVIEEMVERFLLGSTPEPLDQNRAPASLESDRGNSGD
jgi:alginate O-acetyltransferase complex protein AlgJ